MSERDISRPQNHDREFAIINYENGFVRLRIRMTLTGIPYIIREHRMDRTGMWVTDRVFYDGGPPDECVCDRELTGAPIQWENPECPIHGLTALP